MVRKLIASDGAYIYQLRNDRGELDPAGKLEARYTPLLWGDPVDVVEERPGMGIKILYNGTEDGWLGQDVKLADQLPVLGIAFVDVGQGDGAVIVTPTGKRIVVDGGEFSNLAHYVHRIAGWPNTQRYDVDALVLTHGDADHFKGLNELFFRKKPGQASRSFTGVHCARLYHNGLAKGSGTTAAAFGSTIQEGGGTFLPDLYEDVLDLPDGRLNQSFKTWKRTLRRLRDEQPTAHPPGSSRALHAGSADPFDFAAGQDLAIEVLGPIRHTLQDGRPALRYRSSAGQTINGHSVILRITYGNLRIFMGGDLNRTFEDSLVKYYADRGELGRLKAEVLKVPHHGSDDLSIDFLDAVNPVVSVISSGDEASGFHSDHIHPRAVLLGALGKASRVPLPLIFCTELSAFFQFRTIDPEGHEPDGQGGFRPLNPKPARLKLHERLAWGIIHLRTDGTRLLLHARGAKGKHETYAFSVDANGTCKAEKDRVVTTKPVAF